MRPPQCKSCIGLLTHHNANMAQCYIEPTPYTVDKYHNVSPKLIHIRALEDSKESETLKITYVKQEKYIILWRHWDKYSCKTTDTNYMESSLFSCWCVCHVLGMVLHAHAHLMCIWMSVGTGRNIPSLTDLRLSIVAIRETRAQGPHWRFAEKAVICTFICKRIIQFGLTQYAYKIGNA